MFLLYSNTEIAREIHRFLVFTHMITLSRMYERRTCAASCLRMIDMMLGSILCRSYCVGRPSANEYRCGQHSLKTCDLKFQWRVSQNLSPTAWMWNRNPRVVLRRDRQWNEYWDWDYQVRGLYCDVRVKGLYCRGDSCWRLHVQN